MEIRWEVQTAYLHCASIDRWLQWYNYPHKVELFSTLNYDELKSQTLIEPSILFYSFFEDEH